MFQFIKSLLRSKPAINTYSFSLDFFINADKREFFRENGYVIIDNVVSNDAIDKITLAYETLTKSNDFFEVDGFITSANYGMNIQKKIHQILAEVNNEVLPKIFNINKIHHNLLNVLVLKFFKDKNEFFPHQDVSLIDENEGPTIFAWIPTENIDTENGSLLVLPKSHKSFRWQRTHNQKNSPFHEIYNLLIKKMIPLYLNKGDLILFDNTLIHASLPNKTTKVRIAMNTGIAPKMCSLVHYQAIENKNRKILKYIVDEKFWHSGAFSNPNSVPIQYNKPKVEYIKRKTTISYSEIKKYLD